MAELAKLPNIVGVKDYTDMGRPVNPGCHEWGWRRLLFPLWRRRHGRSVLAAGGGLSVTANVAPRMCSDMQQKWREGDIPAAWNCRTD